MSFVVYIAVCVHCCPSSHPLFCAVVLSTPLFFLSAKELKKGMHGGQASSQRVVDLSIRAPLSVDSKESAPAAGAGGRKGSTASNGGDNKLAMQQRLSHSAAARFLATLKAKRELNAIVEHVFSGSRVKVFVPSENCMFSFALAGTYHQQHTPSSTSHSFARDPMICDVVDLIT